MFSMYIHRKYRNRTYIGAGSFLTVYVLDIHTSSLDSATAVTVVVCAVADAATAVTDAATAAAAAAALETSETPKFSIALLWKENGRISDN